MTSAEDFHFGEWDAFDAREQVEEDSTYMEMHELAYEQLDDGLDIYMDESEL